MFWTDEQIATLKRLRLVGFSASLIAEQLVGVSRSAVIGKLFRLGLCAKKGRNIPIQKKKREKREKRPQANGLASLPPDMRAQRLDRLKVQKSFETESKPSTFCTLLELTTDRCRWPIGEPGSESFGYCGGMREIGSYCDAHAQIAYVPVKKR